MEDAQFLVQWDEHPTHLATRLGYLLEHQSLVDVTLMCNTHTLKVHRAVLAACSPYFERQLGNHPLIVLKDMKFSVLKSLVEFMYCGETSVSEENLTPLLEAAKFFEVKGLAAMTKETVCLPNASHSSKSVNGTSSTSGYNRGSGRGRGRGRGRPPLNPSSKIGSPTESAQILLSLSGNSQATGNQQFLTTSKNVKIDPSSVLSDKKGYEPRRRGRRRGALNSAFREKLLREADTLAIESLKRDLSEDGESPLLTSLLSKSEKPAEPRPDDSKYLQTLKDFGLPTNVPILLDNGEGKLVTLTEDVLKSVMDSDGNVQFHVAEETEPPKNSVLNNKKPKQSDDESDPSGPIKTEAEDTINETILESLRNGAASEAEQDPEAVVLFEVTGDKKVEKYVVSAKEVNALKTLNEQLAKQKKQLADMTTNNVSTIDVVGTNTKVAELKLKIGKTKSVLSQVMECAQHGLREKLKSYTSEPDEKKPQSQVLELEFIDGNGEKIEGYQVEGTVVGKRVETKENDLLGLFDMSSLDEKESKPLLTTDETKDMSYQLVMNNHLEEHNENIPYDQIEAMIGETESNIVIDHKNEYIIGNGENMMNHDDNYVQDMSGGEYVIYGNSDSVLPDMDGESGDNFVQNEFIVYGEEEEKTGLKIDGVETEAQYIVYTSEEKTDNTEKDEFVIYPPGKENRGGDKEVPLAVGLVPLKDALHKLQTMSDHQPRRTRSNSSSDQLPCHPTKRRSSLSSSEPDRIDKKLRPDPADPL